YRIIQIDPDFVPAETTTQEVFGIQFAQKRNTVIPTLAGFDNIVTENKQLPDNAKRDMLVALIALKYTQSNSVCFAKDGQLIGVGAGQQSRIHCVRLAAAKAETWWLRQHPTVLNLPFREKIGRPERDNAIDQFLLDGLSEAEERHWLQSFKEVPGRLSSAEKRHWLTQLQDATLGSDAFFPFRDSIDRAQQSGVAYVVQPGGSIRDNTVIDACNEYAISMAFTGTRLFHH
ncbi:MAG TPA: phosphoribosylaminoimidazolecarboxamide formyltransferase, partial [Anaerolineae bacterium]|nr:phosphoribosylaminoimidazolecarboxamide formyltransferase [Anaerolineae bacterium]